MKNSILLLTIFYFFACTKSGPDLNGHWHIEYVDGSRNYFGSDYLTIDIQNDSIAIFGENMFGLPRMKTTVDLDKSEMYFWTDGIILKFNYGWNGDELILVSDGQEFIGTKCEGTCCDREEDYFTSSQVDIQLPTFKDSTNLKWADPIIPFDISIGIPKKNNQATYGKGFEIFDGNRLIGLDIEKFKLQEERFLIKIPESMRHLYTVAITADQKTPTALIQRLITNITKDKPQKIIYLMRSDEREVKIYFKEFKEAHLAQLKRSGVDWGSWLSELDESIYKSTRFGHVKVD